MNETPAKGESLLRRFALVLFSFTPRFIRSRAWRKWFLDYEQLDDEALKHQSDVDRLRVMELEKQTAFLNDRIKVAESSHRVELAILTQEIALVTQMFERIQERVRADTAESIRRRAAAMDFQTNETA